MKISDNFAEKYYDSFVEDESKKYGPELDISKYTKTTAGKFLEERNTSRIPCVAYAPKRDKKEVENAFLRDLYNLKSSVDIKFINSANDTIKVTRQYFPANLVEVDGKKEYWSTINSKEYLGGFSSVFIPAIDSENATPIAAKDIMDDDIFSYHSPEYFETNGKANLLEIHLFPIWRVEVEYNNHTYVNYVSDVVSDSKILYADFTTEALAQIKKDERRDLIDQELNQKMDEWKAKEIKKSKSGKFLSSALDKIDGLLYFSAIGLFIISWIMHIITGNVASQGSGYCGFLVDNLGTFIGGFFTYFCAGFSLIGAMFWFIGFAFWNKNKEIAHLITMIVTNAVIIADIVLYVLSVIELV